MAATSILTVQAGEHSISGVFDRQELVDCVLGTMGAERELPSDEAQRLMQQYVSGELSLEEMSSAILEHATRSVHEANARRLAVR